jgi:hypothetical protein
MRGLWGGRKTIPTGEAFDWNGLFGGLISHKLRPADIAELTLTEALLYTLANEKPGTTSEQAHHKAKVLSKLSIEDRIALGILRTGG